MKQKRDSVDESRFLLQIYFTRNVKGVEMLILKIAPHKARPPATITGDVSVAEEALKNILVLY